MDYTIEKHVNGFVLVRSSGNTVNDGAPHMKSAKLFKTSKLAEEFRDLINVDTLSTKDNWTEKHYVLFETIPSIVRDIAGDLFEIKWYSHANYDGMIWEVSNNLYDKSKLAEFKAAYDALVDEQKNLIYYAYEA